MLKKHGLIGGGGVDSMDDLKVSKYVKKTTCMVDKKDRSKLVVYESLL